MASSRLNPNGRSASPRRRWAVGLKRHCWPIVVLWGVGIAPLLWWGLPTARIDPLLFGRSGPWSPQRYDPALQAASGRGFAGGADVDRNPIQRRDRLVELTATPEQRAEIVMRYRLYSRQPDEMITFRALSSMHPRAGDFDPRMYQYGGAYIYLVGLALGVAHVAGLVQLSGDIHAYLADPESFGRMYVVARSLSLIFAGWLLVGVFALARRVAGTSAGWLALLLTAAAPVFMCGALEAKPHMLSAAALFWAVLAAARYYGRPKVGRLVRLAVLAGLAFGFVLTGLVGVVLIPLAVLSSPGLAAGRRWRHLTLGLAIFFGVYALTNPYVVHHALFDPRTLRGNLGNSTAMYDVARFGSGLLRVAELLQMAAGIFPWIGLLAWGIAVRRWGWRAIIAAGPAVVLLAICVAIGAGKPAEFARFLVFPVAMLAVSTAAGTMWLWRRRKVVAGIVLAGVVLTLGTPAYLMAFSVDARLHHESRFLAGQYLAQHAQADQAIGVVQEPAPYAVPPLDFGRRRVVLLPRSVPSAGAPALPHWLVTTADGAGDFASAWWVDRYRLRFNAGAEASPITWANKPAFVFRRIDPLGTAEQ